MLLIYLRSVVRDPSLVDDLFQETLLTAWKRLDDFDRQRPFGPWLRGIARNLVLAAMRRPSRRIVTCNPEVLELLDRRCEGMHTQPGDTLDDKMAVLRDCLQRLPDRFRLAIQLRYLDDIRGRRLAQRLDTTIESTKKLLQRGRQRLLECLQRKSVFAEDLL